MAAHPPHHELLERAGFIDIDAQDCTTEFAVVARAWIDQWELHRDELVDRLGGAEFEQRQTERRIQLSAVQDGLLRRTLFVATRPE